MDSHLTTNLRRRTRLSHHADDPPGFSPGNIAAVLRDARPAQSAARFAATPSPWPPSLTMPPPLVVGQAAVAPARRPCKPASPPAVFTSSPTCCVKAIGRHNRFKADCVNAILTIQTITCHTKPFTPLSTPRRAVSCVKTIRCLPWRRPAQTQPGRRPARLPAGYGQHSRAPA